MTNFLTFIFGFVTGLVFHAVVMLMLHRIDNDDEELHSDYDED